MSYLSIGLYIITHIIPLLFTIVFIYMFKSKAVHYKVMCFRMNLVFILYLTLLALVILIFWLYEIPYCCDADISFHKGLWEASKLEPTFRAMYDFIWEAGPSHAWPEGYKSTFRTVCVIVAYICFTLMFVAIAIVSHGLIMFLTIITYSVVFVVAFHLPFAFGFCVMWMFCLYYQSQALRRKYWTSYNIEPPIMGEYFGDHFY